MVVCYDPPSRQQLAALAAVGEVVLIVAPGDEAYIARIAPTRRPIQSNAPAASAANRDAVLRRQIGSVVDEGASAAGLYALAPLFEQHDPQLVAAALFTLWQRADAVRPAPTAVAGIGDRVHAGTIAPAGGRDAAGSSSGPPAVVKLWIGAGKNDDATVADFVAVLVREVGVERGRIGRIELRDTFALVEVPAADAESIALRLSGITIRKRKLTARVDGGRGSPPKRRP
jgi:ATP-dependent RNA helicase DeaD